MINKNDNIQSIKPYEPIRYKRKYSFIDLKGKPKDIKQEERYITHNETTLRDAKNLLKGLNNTAGTAASIASFISGGGWAATRLLNGNKASNLGIILSKNVLSTNKADTYGDISSFIEEPSASKAAEIGIGLGLGKYKDFGKKSRQIAELFSQGLNVKNM